MNILDIVLIIPLVFGCIQGLRHGFVKEIGSLLAIVFGIYLARFWSDSLSRTIENWIDCSSQLSLVIAYIVAFFIGVLGIHLLAYLLSKILDLGKVGWINKIIGAVFGTFKWLLILSFVLNMVGMINSFAPLIEKKNVQNSVLYKPIENTMGNVLPFLDFNKIKAFSHDLSK